MTDWDFHGLHGYGLRLVLEAARPLPPKGFHGSWLRGLLGHALYRGVCIHSEPRCEGCALRASCPYPQVFKPHLLGRDRLPAYVVHGWRIQGARCEADLVLPGSALRHVADWLKALAEQAGKLDLGGAGPGRLLAVRDLVSRRLVFEKDTFRPGAMLTPLHPAQPPRGPVTLRLLTPLVSKHQPGLDPLLRPLRTRVQRLVNDYGDGGRLQLPESPWRIRRIVLRETVIPRGCGNPRQVKGLKGELEMTGITPEGARLLAAGLYFHAGGETSLGFGRYGWA